MKLIQLVAFLASKLSLPAYPLEFPVNTALEQIIAVDIINGGSTGGITEVNFQIMTRSLHPSTAEELGNTIISALHKQTNLTWDSKHIILIQATSPNPFYSGKDNANKYIYISNFRMLVE